MSGWYLVVAASVCGLLGMVAALGWACARLMAALDAAELRAEVLAEELAVARAEVARAQELAEYRGRLVSGRPVWSPVGRGCARVVDASYLRPVAGKGEVAP